MTTNPLPKRYPIKIFKKPFKFVKSFVIKYSNKAIYIIKFIANLFDYSDIEFIGGFALFTYGLYLISLSLACVISGAILMTIAQLRNSTKRQ